MTPPPPHTHRYRTCEGLHQVITNMKTLIITQLYNVQQYEHTTSIAFWRCVVELVRRVWRYQWGSQNPWLKEEQTTQWPKEKEQKNKQRSTKHTHKTKDQVKRIPLTTGGEIRCSGRESTFCSTSGARRVNLAHGYNKK